MTLADRQKELLTGLSIVLVFIVGFGAAEGMLRVVQAFKYGEADVVEKGDAFFRDRETGLRLPKPGSRIGRVRINSVGFRGPEVMPSPPPHTLRLAFLGSSTTYDAASPEGQNWPELTAKKVQSQLPPGCAADFVNAGLPGFGSEHMQTHFEAHVKRFRPDVVIIVAGDVTSDMQEALQDQGIEVADFIKPSWLGQHSLAWRKIEKNIRVIRLQRAAFRPEGKIPFDHVTHVEAFEHRLTMLVETVTSAGALPVLATIASQVRRDQSREVQLAAANTALFYNPFISIPELLDARDAYNAAIVRVGGKTGAVVVEHEDEIPGDREHFVDTAHFAPRGSELMARRLAAGLVPTEPFRERLRRIGGSCAVS